MQRVCLVTGASRGIGAAIADALGAAGATVVGTATTEAGAAAISERFAAKGLAGAGMALDVGSPTAVDELIARVTEQFGAPLGLVNNAGITQDNIVLRMKGEEWARVIDSNLNSIFRLSKAVLRGMTKARWGRIVNISSWSVRWVTPGRRTTRPARPGWKASREHWRARSVRARSP